MQGGERMWDLLPNKASNAQLFTFTFSRPNEWNKCEGLIEWFPWNKPKLIIEWAYSAHDYLHTSWLRLTHTSILDFLFTTRGW